jgi:hypothetical protein
MHVHRTEHGGIHVSILGPISLINCVATHIIGVANEVLDKEATILKAVTIEGKGSIKGNSNEAPFLVIVGNGV